MSQSQINIFWTTPYFDSVPFRTMQCNIEEQEVSKVWTLYIRRLLCTWDKGGRSLKQKNSISSGRRPIENNLSQICLAFVNSPLFCPWPANMQPKVKKQYMDSILWKKTISSIHSKIASHPISKSKWRLRGYPGDLRWPEVPKVQNRKRALVLPTTRCCRRCCCYLCSVWLPSHVYTTHSTTLLLPNFYFSSTFISCLYQYFLDS